MKYLWLSTHNHLFIALWTDKSLYVSHYPLQKEVFPDQNWKECKSMDLKANTNKGVSNMTI